jgi:hypothetical protein
MLIFYGLHKNGLWYITDKMPEKESYIVIHAETRKDAECKLFEIVVEHNPRIYL